MEVCLLRETDLHVCGAEDNPVRAGRGVRDAVGESDRLGVLFRDVDAGALFPIGLAMIGDGARGVDQPGAVQLSTVGEFPVLAAVADHGGIEKHLLKKLPRAGQHRGDDEAVGGVVRGGEVVGAAVGVREPLRLRAVVVAGTNDEGVRVRQHRGDGVAHVLRPGDGIAVEEAEDVPVCVGGAQVARGGGTEALVLLCDDGQRQPRGGGGQGRRAVVGDHDLEVPRVILRLQAGDDLRQLCGRVVVRDDRRNPRPQPLFPGAAPGGGDVGPGPARRGLWGGKLGVGGRAAERLRPLVAHQGDKAGELAVHFARVGRVRDEHSAPGG